MEDLPTSLPATPPERPELGTALENMWRVNDLLNEWVRFHDNKAYIILTANAILTGVVINSIGQPKPLGLSHGASLVAAALALLAAAISASFCLRCITPAASIGAGNSLIFYGHVARKYKTWQSYEAAAYSAFTNPTEAWNQISQQVWVNARVAAKKSLMVTWGVRFLEVMLICILVGLVTAAFHRPG